jgi:hypothetical protein
MQITLERTYKKANRLTNKPGLDAKTEEQIRELWEQVHGDYDYSNPREFGRFLSSFLRDRYNETEPKNRRQRLCGCGNPSCAVAAGEIPARLKPSWSLNEGRDAITPAEAREFVNKHRSCTGIDAALSEWQHKRSETEHALRQIISLAKQATDDGVDVAFDEDNIPR